jgi:polysaccharide biosynthesis transport protein
MPPGQSAPNEGLMEQVHLREYIRVLRKHAWLVAACFVVILTTVALGTYLQRPIYRATTKALLERETSRVVNFQDVGPVESESLEAFQTQVQIVKSRPVIQGVIDTLDLKTRRPELAQASDPVEALLGAISVDPVLNTRLIAIQVEDPDPKLAADIANALATSYVNQNLELKLSAARDALNWLTAQVSDLKTKVNESELALQRYREQAGLVQVEEKQSLGVRKLAEFNSAYIEAKAKRLEMETRVAELKRASSQPEMLESSPLVINNPLVQKLKGQLVELEVQKSKLLKTYREKHPEVVKIQSQIDEIQQKIREEVGRLGLSMESEYNALKARENAMLQAVNQYRDEAQSLGKKEIQLGILKREADSNQQLYDVLLKRLKESSLSQGLDSSNVRIVEPAIVPTRPVKPRKSLNLALGAVVGLAVGLCTAFFLEYMDDSVRTPEQVERALGVPVFSLIPMLSPRARS